MKDGSFFKIRDITLGILSNRNFLKHLNLSRLRVYATAKNFFTFSKIDNYDPEQGRKYFFPYDKTTCIWSECRILTGKE